MPANPKPCDLARRDLTGLPWLLAALGLMLVAGCGSSESLENSRPRLSLGFAVDTAPESLSRWGIDPALFALPAVVRAWESYLAIRADSARRPSYWSAEDRQRFPDPDLAASESYLLHASPMLVEALPLVPGDSSRWVLRTVHVGAGTAARPGLLAMERVYLAAEEGRWALVHPSSAETEGWRHESVGLINYVVHPAIQFNAARANETAQWVEDTAQRFGVADRRPISYYQVPDLSTAFRVMGLDWGLSTDRAGGRANARARVVFAADPRFAEAYRHELAHVILDTLTTGKSSFVGEGIAYWLGGARGKDFPAMLRDLAAYLDQEPRITLRAILASEGRAASARYAAAAAVFELAHRRGGDVEVIRVVEALGKPEPTLDALAQALRISPDQLEAEWQRLVASYAGDSHSDD